MATPNEDGTRKYRITTLISGSGSNLQALLDALSPSAPISLSNCQITSVLSSRSDAYGLTRARQASPPVPAEAFPLLRWRKAREAEGKSATRGEWELDLAAKIRATRPDLVVLAGWMLILSAEFLTALVRDWDEPSSSPSSSSPSPSSPPPSLPPSVDPSGLSVSSGLPTPGRSPYPPSLQPQLKGRPIPIINLHPALPGQFPGAHAIQDAWEAFNMPSESTLRGEKRAAKEVLEGVAALALSPPTGETADETVAAVSGEEATPRRITKTGIMIHRVIPLLDAGAPVVVKEVPMVEGESLADLEKRIHEVEHVGIVEAVKRVTELVREGEWWEEEEVGREGGDEVKAEEGK
ncbi:hypothetical protein JCM8097_005549 [Rhodosporidiobolus ruineniae]